MSLNFISSLQRVDPSTFTINNIFNIEGNTYDLANDPIAGALFGPASIYYNGNTYFVLAKQQQLSINNFHVCKYNSSNSTVQISEIVATSNFDYHNKPIITIDSSGFIYAGFSNHGSNILLYKSDSAEDITAFSSLSHTGLTAISDYPKLYFKNGNFILISRTFRGSSKYDLNCAISTDCITWTENRLTECSIFESGATDIRHYPFWSYNAFDSNFFYFFFYKRSTFAAGISYHKRYSLKTPLDANFGIVWYNDSENYSRNIAVDGFLTESILDSNYLIVSDPTYPSTSPGWPSSSFSGGHYHNIALLNTGIINTVNSIQYTKQIEEHIFTNYARQWYKRKGTGLQRFDLQGNLLDQAQGTYQGKGGTLVIPNNIAEVPQNQKFAILRTDKKGGSDTVNDTIKADVYIYEGKFI